MESSKSQMLFHAENDRGCRLIAIPLRANRLVNTIYLLFFVLLCFHRAFAALRTALLHFFGDIPWLFFSRP
jgi:hypothetical protein